MAGTAALDLREAVVFLAAAGLVVPVMHKFRVSPVLGFLTIGLIIGPHGLGRLVEMFPVLDLVVIKDLDSVALLGELGVMFLLFMIGLELSIERLWIMRHLVFGLGGAQVVITSAVISGIASFFGNPLEAAIVLGACLSLSSTAIVMQLLTESGRLGAPVGRTSFAILLFQDLAVVPILFLVGIMATAGHGSVWLELALALVKAGAAITAILILGRVIARPLLRQVVATGSRELFLAAVLLAIIGTAAMTEAAGLSLALGAFLAGLLLAETEYRHQIAVDLEPFKGLLLAVFFVSVGLAIDIATVLSAPILLALSVIGLFLIKGMILLALARLFRLPMPVAFETALLLGQGGEFAFIVINLATGMALLPAPIAQFMLIVTGLSMVATPAMAALARRLATRLTPDGKPSIEALPEVDQVGHVLIIGFGRVGQLIGHLLDEQRMPFTAIDANAAAVADLRTQSGRDVHWGDASHPDILQRLGLVNASVAVITMNDADAAARVVKTIRGLRPDIPVYARARDSAHGIDLIHAGATEVVPETVEASLQLGEAVLISAGIPDEAARMLVAEARERERLKVHRA